MPRKLPSLQTFIGNQIERLSGIKSWDIFNILGRNNLERIVQLSQDNIYRLMSEHESADELKKIKNGIDYISNELIPKSIDKPLLPRLRNEVFRKNDEVFAYLGDTNNITVDEGWIHGKVTAVNKSFRKDWADGRANSGYFWKVTVETAKNIFPNDNKLVFSTSEPRAIFEWEYYYLKNSGDSDFLSIYSDNAFRDWKPLWCLEKSLDCRSSSMNMKNWIESGKIID